MRGTGQGYVAVQDLRAQAGDLPRLSSWRKRLHRGTVAFIDHFFELIERAQSGQATVITKRGRVVAKFVHAKACSDSGLKAALSRAGVKLA